MAAEGVTATTITIGQSAAFSGPAAELGNEMRKGILAYFDAVNRAGGVNGRKLVLKSLDDGYEANRAAENTKKLIADDVFALLGYVGTPTSEASKPIFTEARVPFVGAFTGAELLRAPFNRYIFNVRASYYAETDAIVNLIAKLDMKRIAVFYQNDSYGKAGLAGVEKAMAARNMKILTTGTVERNSTDVAAAVKEIAAKDPQAVVMISAYKSCAAFIKAMKQANSNPQFMNVSFVGTKALAAELGTEGRGVAVSQVVPFPWNVGMPVVKDYQKHVGAGNATADYGFGSLHRRPCVRRRIASGGEQSDAGELHQRDGDAARLRRRRILRDLHALRSQRVEVRRSHRDRQGRPHPPLATRGARNTQFETVRRALRADCCVAEAHQGSDPGFVSAPCTRRGSPRHTASLNPDLDVTGR
jgi:ABC-type branched-subunit amino acid transport system substrate-binding protein